MPLDLGVIIVSHLTSSSSGNTNFESMLLVVLATLLVSGKLLVDSTLATRGQEVLI
jgi:hypothetical protein